MNLILFEPSEIDRPLPRDDPRARHILDVLRRQPGETFDAGLIDGPRGKATLLSISPGSLALVFTWDSAPPPPLAPLSIIVGLPRPQTARDILREAAALGVTALHFIVTEKGEPSYGQSTLWSSGEWRRQLVAGAGQAFDTRIPTVATGRTLAGTIGLLPTDSVRIALDNYEAALPVGDWPLPAGQPVALALGPERGWSAAERELLRVHCFGLAHLGNRVLRLETAVVAAIAIVRAKLGLM